MADMNFCRFVRRDNMDQPQHIIEWKNNKNLKVIYRPLDNLRDVDLYQMLWNNYPGGYTVPEA